MFNERGKMMDATSYTIIQTIDNNHGLAAGDLIDLLNPVLVLGNKDSHFYDGMEVKAAPTLDSIKLAHTDICQKTRYGKPSL